MRLAVGHVALLLSIAAGTAEARLRHTAILDTALESHLAHADREQGNVQQLNTENAQDEYT